MGTHGSALSRSTLSSSAPTPSPSGHSVGQRVDILQPRDLTTAQSEPPLASEESSWTTTTKPASLPRSTSPEPMERLCQDSGSSRSAHAKESTLETTSTLPGTCSEESLRT